MRTSLPFSILAQSSDGPVWLVFLPVSSGGMINDTSPDLVHRWAKAGGHLILLDGGDGILLLHCRSWTGLAVFGSTFFGTIGRMGFRLRDGKHDWEMGSNVLGGFQVSSLLVLATQLSLLSIYVFHMLYFIVFFLWRTQRS